MRPFSDLSLLSSFHVPFCDHDPHLAPFSAEKNAFFCDFLAVNSDVSAALKRTSFQLFRQRGRKTIFWQFPNKHNNVEVMVFCYQNCSDLLSEKIVVVIEKKLLKFQAEGREFAKFLRSLEQFIQTVKGQNNFW